MIYICMLSVVVQTSRVRSLPRPFSPAFFSPQADWPTSSEPLVMCVSLAPLVYNDALTHKTTAGQSTRLWPAIWRTAALPTLYNMAYALEGSFADRLTWFNYLSSISSVCSCTSKYEFQHKLGQLITLTTIRPLALTAVLFYCLCLPSWK